jgi:hypothetical protein
MKIALVSTVLIVVRFKGATGSPGRPLAIR